MVLILSNDAVMKRAITLLLPECDFTEDASSPHSMLIFDLDSTDSEVCNLEEEKSVIFITRGETAPEISAKSRILRRPFRNREFVSAVSELSNGTGKAQKSKELKLCSGDGGDFKAYFGEESVALTKAEYRLLAALLEKNGEPLSRAEAAEFFDDTDTNVLDVYISYLRKKLKKLRGAPEISTLRGIGYVIAKGDLNR